MTQEQTAVDRSYENLFVGKDGQRTTRRIHGFRLARFVRAWYPVAAEAGCPLEYLVANCNSRGEAALDLLLRLLSEAHDEWKSENDGEPTFEQVCDELASWGAYSQFGAQVIEWEHSGNREVRWGFGDNYSWADLDAVLKAVTLADGQAPDWWDEDWTEYEYFNWRGEQCFVKREDLPESDPRHPDYEAEEA
jgi:hypothetical protein